MAVERIQKRQETHELGLLRLYRDELEAIAQALPGFGDLEFTVNDEVSGTEPGDFAKLHVELPEWLEAARRESSITVDLRVGNSVVLVEPEIAARGVLTSIRAIANRCRAKETPMTIIPPRYADATTTLAEADQWCDSVLDGATTRLLLLGPIWSGKTHHAYAMLKRVLDAGYPSNDISVHESYDLVYGNDYKPRDFEAGPRVTFMDDLTNRVDNRVGATTEPLADDPITQSVMAAGQGALVDAVDRLISRANASWIACASGKEALATCLGEDIAEKLITSAHMVVELPPRPLP